MTGRARQRESTNKLHSSGYGVHQSAYRKMQPRLELTNMGKTPTKNWSVQVTGPPAVQSGLAWIGKGSRKDGQGRSWVAWQAETEGDVLLPGLPHELTKFEAEIYRDEDPLSCMFRLQAQGAPTVEGSMVLRFVSDDQPRVEISGSAR